MAKIDTEIVYKLQHSGPGRWHCRVDGLWTIGAGKTPEAAIKDWQAQHRRALVASAVNKAKGVSRESHAKYARGLFTKP